MEFTLILLSSLISLCSADLISTSFNPCAMEQTVMQEMIDCSTAKNLVTAAKPAVEVFEKRTQIIPGMKATDLIYEVCRINNNSGYTLWRQYLDELDPKVAELVDKHTYECLKARNMAV